MKLFENKDYLEDLQNVAMQIPTENISIIITGATGLVGSFMVDVLLYANKMFKNEHRIYAVGRSKEKMKERFSYACHDNNLYFVEQDVRESFPKNINADYVVSAASNADPYSYALYPAETILTNVLGTKNALEYAKEKQCKKVLFTSTMEVYGTEIDRDSYIEEDFGKIDFNSIRAAYPESKRVSELLCRSYAKEYRIPVVIARLAYIYGPTMSQTDNKVIAQFINNILKNENIVLKSKGTQCRSYLYVADTVAAMFKIMFLGENGDTYNVASSLSSISIYDMAEVAAELGKCKVVYGEADAEEKKGFSKPQNNVLCDEKLKKLNWEANYSFKEGLSQTINILQAVKEI